MMYYVTAFFYYLFIKPLSLLPLRVLYVFSDFLFLIMYYLISYRKEVVFGNMKRVFSDKSENEIEPIAKEFYRHFCDLIIESLKLFSISKKEVINRCRIVNPEVLNKYFEKGKNVSLVCAHHNNWEMAAVAFPPQVGNGLISVIYSPLSNKFFDKKMQKSRSKYGMYLIPKQEVLKFFNTKRERPTMVAFAADQSPQRSNKNVYWMDFLGQETAVMYGTERYSTRYDYSIVYLHIKKVKRGYYELILEDLIADSQATEKGEITEKYTRLMEQDIYDQPAYWLWTHKRWKKKRSEDEA
ncbi:lysophospholipid acyltransferase family protein [Mangrovivirga cuniculi]|uniref:Lipid A biosynthesis acyltransferase n=1 Tax=Mangrovivirga cuniculi TaxID=2715131 RepID=A0A4D7JW99_9BACT|nr:lysophospholipid acyltransferase family protein [Mangrovivirga cuniculi]QCK15085.1 lipid A biosynthesis acyltransferase [Mangrovivirga cuniculi]